MPNLLFAAEETNRLYEEYIKMAEDRTNAYQKLIQININPNISDDELSALKEDYKKKEICFFEMQKKLEPILKILKQLNNSPKK